MTRSRIITIALLLVVIVVTVVLKGNRAVIDADYPKTATITYAKFRSDVSYPWLSASQLGPSTDLVLNIKEWIPGEDYHQLVSLIGHVGGSLLLKSTGNPDIHISLDGSDYSDQDVHLLGATIAPADRMKVKPGAVYTIIPASSGAVPWIINDVTVTAPN